MIRTRFTMVTLKVLGLPEDWYFQTGRQDKLYRRLRRIPAVVVVDTCAEPEVTFQVTSSATGPLAVELAKMQILIRQTVEKFQQEEGL